MCMYVCMYVCTQRVSYAKTKSDVVAKADGTYVPRDRTERAQYNREQREKLENRHAKEEVARRRQEQEQQQQQQQQREQQQQQLLLTGARENVNVPHHILFVEALPKLATSEMVTTLFTQFPGFKEVRMVAAKPGIAFVEFESSQQASVALTGLQGFKITQDDAIIVSFAKK